MTTPAPLPLDLHIRPATVADLSAVLQLRAELGEAHLTEDDLLTSWELLDLTAQTLVAYATDGELIGYAELICRRSGWFTPTIWIHPDYQRRGIATHLLQLMEVQARALKADTLLTQIWRRDIPAQRLLEKAGYELSSMFHMMRLEMTEPPPPPATIPGIVIRPFAVGQDEQAVYEADEEAFIDERGKLPRTYEEWSSRLNMHTEHFDPALWFVAWENDVVAGASLNQAIEGLGEIMHLGIRRPWRGRGLGMALLRHVLQALYQRGIRVAVLNVDASSLTNAHQLYQRVGFYVIDSYCNYTRKL